MNDINSFPSARYGSQADAVAFSAGLRAYMLSIYNYMGLAVAISGLAALGLYMLSVTDQAAAGATRIAGGMFLTPFGQFLFASPFKWVLMLAPVALVFLLGFRIQSMSVRGAQLAFWGYAALVGASIGTVSMLVYTHASIAQVFFITAVAFGGLSLYGYTTKRDLSAFASFLIMGVIGLVIASLVNIFLQSSMLQMVLSYVGVLVFSGLTAWDTQRLKSEYLAFAMEGEEQERSAIMGALSLYLNFVNLFTSLLHIFGQRQE